MRWLVFDMETDSFDGQVVTPFVFGIIYDDSEEFFTYSRSEFVSRIREFDGIALAHNGGKFDTVLMADEFNINDEIKIINGRVAEVKIGLCTVRDSFLIIPSPLAASGKKDDFDYAILARDKKYLRQKNKKLIEKYLMADCRALHELVKVFFDRYGQRLTQAGAALKVWEDELLGCKRRWGGAHDKFFRQFYYGGRCEAFKKGYLGDGWEYLDIKSAYPWAMSQQHTCSNLHDYNLYRKIDKLTEQGFARVIARSKGALPQRGKYNTIYPHHTDLREYFATGWEIIAGLETGLLEITEATVYQPDLTETLKPYVDKYYAEKLAAERSGNVIDRLLAKIFMNSLYGKFGQCADDFKKYFLVEPGEIKQGFDLYQECDNFDILQKPSGGQFFDVALSASITGCVRAKLVRQYNSINSRDFELGYSDTDSIIARGDGLLELFDVGEDLGQWEHVCTLNDLFVGGKKLYAGFDEKEWVTAHKGFSKLDTNPMDIICASMGNTVMINRSAPSINVLGQQKFISRKMQKT